MVSSTQSINIGQCVSDTRYDTLLTIYFFQNLHSRISCEVLITEKQEIKKKNMLNDR